MNSLSSLSIYILCSIITLTNALSGDHCSYMNFGRKNENLDESGKKTLNDSACSGICKKHFRISRVYVPPYSTAELLRSVLKKCCGNCLNVTEDKEYANYTGLTLSTFNSSDFVLPMLGYATTLTLYGHHFVPLVNAPNAFYITPKEGTRMETLIYDCLNLYPLLILCLLLAIVSGFIVWIIETWHNSKEYPRSFLYGLFEGFWYSFVSMTTVGYGDKVVKSAPARLFSVMWILTGIIMFGFLTSSFTNELMKATQPIERSMTGSDVGVLQFRHYDASLIVKHEGILKETSSTWNFNTDVMKLIRMLRTKQIHGFVLDKYTLAYTTEYLVWKKTNVDYFVNPKGETYAEAKDDIDFFLNNTYRTLKTYKGKKLCYGVLIKNTEDYHYFKDAITDNRLPLEISVESEMNALFPRTEDVNLFSPTGKSFKKTALGICCVLCIICVYGVLYELYKYRTYKCNEQPRRRFTAV